MESLGKSLGSIIDERLSSPLVSGFVISWSLINWKFFVILFSDTSVSRTFAMAKGLHGTSWEWWASNVLAPLVAALAYVYVLPWVSRPVHKQWRLNQQAIEDDRQEAARLRRLEISESQMIISENVRLKQSEAEMRVERDGAMDARRTAIDEKVTAQLERDTALSETEAYKRRFVDEKEARENAESSLETSTKHLLRSKRALEQIAQLVTNTHKNFRVVEDGVADNADPLHKLILSDLRARQIIPLTMQMHQLRLLYLFAGESEDSLSVGEVMARVGETVEGVPVRLILEHLKNQGYLKTGNPGNRPSPTYTLTESGYAVTRALAEYDHIFTAPLHEA